MKYNLTLRQKLYLPILWVYWRFSTIKNKKSWHEVKKGMEHHEHKFTKPISLQNTKFLQCEHEGCCLCKPIN